MQHRKWNTEIFSIETAAVTCQLVLLRSISGAFATIPDHILSAPEMKVSPEAKIETESAECGSEGRCASRLHMPKCCDQRSAGYRSTADYSTGYSPSLAHV
jgi:hypothetical protein